MFVMLSVFFKEMVIVWKYMLNNPIITFLLTHKYNYHQTQKLFFLYKDSQEFLPQNIHHYYSSSDNYQALKTGFKVHCTRIF